MNFSSLLPLRRVALLGAVAALLLGAGRASAVPDTYEVDNYTASSSLFGDPLHPVVDDLTFSNLRITETYIDGFMQTSALGSLDTSTITLLSPATFAAPGHGLLTSAILTGQIGPNGSPATPTLNISTQLPGGPVTNQFVFSNFSTSLFGPDTNGVSVGQFTLYDSSSNTIVNGPAEIRVAPVPEATSAVSLGLLVLLGLGSLAVSRRRTASAK